MKVDDDRLRDAIKVYNRSRILLDEFDELRTADAPPFTGTDALSVILAGTTMPRDEYNGLLEQFIAESKKAKGDGRQGEADARRKCQR